MQTETRAEPAPVDRMSRAGRVLRVLAALVVAAGLIIGTWGSDDHFPFGPFKMYVSSDPYDPFFPSSDPLDSPVKDTRVVANNAAGEWLYLHQANTGFRRAELEGQLPRIQRHPELLGGLAQAYERRRPTRPKLVRITVIVRWWELEDGRATGEYTDHTVVVWSADGGRR